jgi:phage shock protein PspC (stress-responsive transcriptional regulator)
MSMSEELARLSELHQRGALSDEEFARAKARVLNATAAPQGAGGPAPVVTAVNSLRRSRDDRWLGGVCGGIGLLTGVASWVWRLLFVALAVCGGTGVLLYLLMWIFVPQEEMPAAGPVRPV